MKTKHPINHDNADDSRWGLPLGCLFAVGSALMTCLFLFINGSVVLAVAQAFARTGPDWAREPRFIQFVVFFFPVVLVVLQWIIVDYIRNRFRRRRA